MSVSFAVAVQCPPNLQHHHCLSLSRYGIIVFDFFLCLTPLHFALSFPVHILSLSFPLSLRLLAYDPGNRIRARDALEHPFFKENPPAKAIPLMPTFPSKSARRSTSSSSSSHNTHHHHHRPTHTSSSSSSNVSAGHRRAASSPSKHGDTKRRKMGVEGPPSSSSVGESSHRSHMHK